MSDALDSFTTALVGDDPEALYDRAPCGYLSTAPDGTILKVNQTFLDWTGHRREELVGRRRFVDLLTAGGRLYHETHYAPMLQMHGRAREIALEIVGTDGRRLPALVSSVLEADEQGVPLVIRTAVFDATERRAYERELLLAKERAEASEARATMLARTLQETLIPPAAPDVPGLEVAAAYRPAGRGDEVGGDFYDIFEVAEDDWVVAVVDVCGKGVEAAVITAAARHTIRAAAVRQPAPGQVFETLNEVLRRHERSRFCTAVLLRLRRIEGAWTVTSAAAGHPHPLLVPALGGVSTIGRTGTLLGVFDDLQWHDTETALRSGDAIVLYTDGVTEGRRGDEFFGDHRLMAALAVHRGTAASLCDGILGDVLGFQAGDPRDDIVVVVVRVP